MHPIYVVYGTESFNTEELAERTGEALSALGLPVPVKVVDMDDFDCDLLPSLHTLLVLTSTYGNGDPPSNAEALHSHLMKAAPPLPGLRFAVCGLGDSVYPHFAQCGKDFDRRLGELGATRIVDRQDCDVDYDAPWAAWMVRVKAALPRLTWGPAPAVVVAAQEAPREKPAEVASRRNPYLAVVRENRVLTGAGSTKEVRHVALEVPATIALQPGDSVGIWASNDPGLVAEVLERTALSATASVQIGDTTLLLGDALSHRLDLATVDARLLALAAEAAPSSVFGIMGLDAGLRQAFVARHHVVDVLSQVTARPTAQALVDALRPLAPRLYSLASSRLAHPDTVDLLVAVVRYDLSGRPRTGVFSGQISARTAVGDRLPLYVHPSPGFRLCEDDRPIILIGPGTGVAPFRAFLQERAARKAKGPAWLFFGERNAATDFHYAAEWRAWLAAGQLARLDTAFSRDSAEKVYVQHRMAVAGAELHAWLGRGAALYVCGDARHMAADVHAALKLILRQADGLDDAGAEQALTALEAAGRYQRDVY